MAKQYPIKLVDKKTSKSITHYFTGESEIDALQSAEFLHPSHTASILQDKPIIDLNLLIDLIKKTS